jgi:hypothetical protein
MIDTYNLNVYGLIATVVGPKNFLTSSSGNSGSGFVDYQNYNNDYIEWNVTANNAGQANLVFGYALKSGNRPLQITVNGLVVSESFSFPGTGGWGSWGETTALAVTLNAGVNTIRATAIGSSGGNLDYLDVTTVASASAPQKVASANSAPVYIGDTEITIGGNAALSNEELLALSQTVDMLALNEGNFTMEVTTESGTYTFNLSPGKLFDYTIVSESEFDVTYSDSTEVTELLNILFSDDPILEVKFP